MGEALQGCGGDLAVSVAMVVLFKSRHGKGRTKDPYNFEFLPMGAELRELRDLGGLIAHLQSLILELVLSKN